jgi:hypothetical protein
MVLWLDDGFLKNLRAVSKKLEKDLVNPARNTCQEHLMIRARIRRIMKIMGILIKFPKKNPFERGATDRAID